LHDHFGFEEFQLTSFFSSKSKMARRRVADSASSTNRKVMSVRTAATAARLDATRRCRRSKFLILKKSNPIAFPLQNRKRREGKAKTVRFSTASRSRQSIFDFEEFQLT
jgi:hypothetical protein